jgi:hypothetical protein
MSQAKQLHSKMSQKMNKYKVKIVQTACSMRLRVSFAYRKWELNIQISSIWQ